MKAEYDALNEFINSQDWLTKAEKDFLKSKIDYNSPPSRSELFQWKDKIDKAIKKAEPVNLTELGILIANSEREALTGADIIKIGPSFAVMESELGVMSREVIAGLKSKSDTITDKHATVESFNVKKLTELLDGDQGPVIKKIKELISSPEFTISTITYYYYHIVGNGLVSSAVIPLLN